ncbi:Pre protein translocase subunit Sec66-domain-containing protein [Schizophyllum amplum]|uniref:Pre protein translocase subunit Sec66-domain-containing protein n=1 Tax=Schizophyllum amplum TaxID=97359 RepID=A0A550BYC0_9AGAR|nr:Pre protein translocase subunit Sec66-domain-containing protein [Auriculariopsis ampla]
MASATVLAPVAYLFIIIGGLYTFSYFYRRRAARKVLEPYFPTHKERNVYMSLVRMTDPPAPDALLKAALVRRAMQDVQRVVRIREDKPALAALLQKGSIGDELWSSFQAAEKEMEVELAEVVGEANSFVEGWGQFIFQTANEMLVNERMRTTFEKIPEARTDLEQKYDRKAKFQPVPVMIRQGPAAPGTPGARSITPGPRSATPGVGSAAPSPQATPAKRNVPLPATSGLASPVTPTSAGLAPPASAIPSSVTSGYVSSDAESATSTSRASGKKGKKRK